MPSQQLLQFDQSYLVRQLLAQQDVTEAVQGSVVMAQELGTNPGGQLAQAPPSHYRQGSPALLEQPCHDPAGQGTLADPAHAPQQHPRLAAMHSHSLRMVTEHPHDPA
jgi:hypothetical protein